MTATVLPAPETAAAPGTAPAPGPAWTAFEPRHLVSLRAVARARSFRGAARALGCSQSVLSQHVAQLERVVGRPLAERRPGSGDVAMTAAGEALLGHVEPILAILHAARADLAALAAPAAGVLRLGVAPHLAGAVPERAVAPFLRRAPEAEVVIESGGDPIAALAEGRLDAVLGDLPADGPRVLCHTLLAPEPYVLAAPSGWGVVRRPGVAAADLLEHLPVAVAGGDADAPRIARDLQAAGLPAPVACEAPGLPSLLARVRAGTTAAILPAAAAGAHDPAFARLDLESLVAPRLVALLWQRERRHAPLVDVLVDAARSVLPAAERTAPPRLVAVA